MITNADCTWYTKSVVLGLESWASQIIRKVNWQHRKAANVIQSGLLSANSVNIYIPPPNEDLAVNLGDIFVKGAVTDIISPSFTITDLKEKYANVVKVTSVDPMDCDSQRLRHLQIGAS